jgi:ribosomal protein S27AE
VIIAVVTIRINFILMKYHRCPACGRMPIAGGMRGGVMLDPEQCPKCGALLR